MTRLRQSWSALNTRYSALSRREKWLVAAAAVLGPILIGKALILDPQLVRIHALERSIAQQAVSVTEMQAQVGSLQQRLQNDPDAAAKAELAALLAEQARLDGDIRQSGRSLVRPEEMNGLLERLLARHAGLRLLSLKTLAPRSVLADKEGATKSENGKPAEKLVDLYRHGVEIRLEGSYGELQAYLLQLEQLQQRLLWGSLHYKVTDYPKAEMSLMVYTLSPDRAWLAL